MKNEVKIGIFVFLAIVALFFLTAQVGSFKNFSKEGYTLYANLDDAAGLEVNSKVKANGIEVGYIQALQIKDGHIRAKLFLNKGVKLPEDSRLKPMEESMLGGKYAGITLGSAKSFLRQGAEIKSERSLASISKASDSMMGAAEEFKAFLVDFKEVFNGESRDNIKKIFSNLEAITTELKAFTRLNKLNETAENFNNMAISLTQTGEKFSQTAGTLNDTLPTIMKNLDSLVKDLKVASVQLKNDVPIMAKKFTQIGENLESIINENRKPLNHTITSADAFFATGEDTFSKVDALLDTIDKVQLEVSMRGEWMGDDSYGKGYLSLDYRPSDTKSYKFDVAGMKNYSRLDERRALIEPKLHEKTKLLVSAQIAKRFYDVTLRGGLIENTFGAGFDYYMLSDSLKASAELYDINAENDIRGEKAHAKVSARYTFLKHLDIYGGVDNFLNRDASNLFLGLGVRFYDDDLKTLIMSQSLGSMAK